MDAETRCDGRRVLLAAGAGAEALQARRWLTGLGARLIATADAEEALAAVLVRAPDVLIVALDLPDNGARWLLSRLRAAGLAPGLRCVAIGTPEAEVGVLVELGVDVLLLPPIAIDALRVAVGSAAATTASERLRRLFAMTLLRGELAATVATLAAELPVLVDSDECALVVGVADRIVVAGTEAGAPAEAEAPAGSPRATAAASGVPVIGMSAGSRRSALALPLRDGAGPSLGTLGLDGVDLAVVDLLADLRVFAARLAVEAGWRTVHERLITDRERLREVALFDPLLGVWSRAALDQSLAGEVAGAQRRGEPMTVALLDVRSLRQINERHGHAAGDAALRHVATTVRQELRVHDVVARFAGDAFAILLSGTPLTAAVPVIERVASRLNAAPLAYGEVALSVSVAAGVAALDGEDDTGEAALARAEAALQSAKRRGEPLAVADEDTPMDLRSSQSGLEAGATVGGVYRILHEISRGAMGIVYRAEDLGLGRQVAVKTLRPDLSRDPSFVDRFRREAATAAALRHENLAEVYAFGAEGDTVFFAMELIEGEPLEDRIELVRHEGRAVPLPQLERIAREVASALDAMHRAGVLHRDVKPGNVLLDRVRDRAVLVDVGIARPTGSPAEAAGTPGFTAPECLAGGAEDPTADVYGLAATIYALATGTLPFGGGPSEGILRRQAAGSPVPPSSLREDLPCEVDVVLARGMAARPADRFATPGELAAALAAALSASPVQVGDECAGSLPAKGELRSFAREATRVPTTRPAATAQTRGPLFRATYRVLGARKGAAWVARLSRADPDLARALDPLGPLLAWHPTRAFQRLLGAVAASGRDGESFAAELGRVAAVTSFHRFVGADPMALAPGRVVAAFDLTWHRYHSWGEARVRLRAETSAEVTIAGGPGDVLVCASVRGLLEELAHLAGAVTAHAEHSACEASGADECRFVLRWSLAGRSRRAL